jgi:hypothetical protein
MAPSPPGPSALALVALLLGAAGVTAAAAAEASKDVVNSSPADGENTKKHELSNGGGGGGVSSGAASGSYDCGVCSACFAASAEVRAKERQWSALFQQKGQVARKSQDDTAVASKFTTFKDWTWAGSADELRAEEKALVTEMERVNGALKAAHHEAGGCTRCTQLPPIA